MNPRIEWARRARRKLSRLDRPTQDRLLSAVDRLVEEGRGEVRALKGEQETEYRLRVGDWRVLFTVLQDGTLLIHKLGSRGDIYKGS